MSERLRTEFNQWAADGRGAQLEWHHRPFLEEMLTRMDIHPRDRILELGCGEGWASRTLAELVPQGLVVGLDVSDEMIHNARVKSSAVENVMFLVGEAEDIPWKDEFFTHALSIESFYYYENPEKALHEIFRVLAPGGTVWLLNHLSKENELSLRWVDRLNVPVQVKSAQEYGEMFGQSGFENYSYEMIPERSRSAAESQSKLFSPEEWQRFRETGALLMRARKPAARSGR